MNSANNDKSSNANKVFNNKSSDNLNKFTKNESSQEKGKYDANNSKKSSSVSNVSESKKYQGKSFGPRRDSKPGEGYQGRSFGPRRDDNGARSEGRSFGPRRDDNGARREGRSFGPRRDDNGARSEGRSFGPRRDSKPGEGYQGRSFGPRRDDNRARPEGRSFGPRRDGNGARSEGRSFGPRRDDNRARSEGRSFSPRRDSKPGGYLQKKRENKQKIEEKGKVYFIQSIASMSQFNSPLFDRPEIVFAGRSNAGKSSLINALVNLRVAYTSKKPGKTKTFNIFANGKMNIIDMPGYGYAFVSKAERDNWFALIEEYFSSGRDQLKHVYFLVDSRVGLKDSDIEMIKLAANRGSINSSVVMTKCDKITDDEIEESADKILKELSSHELHIQKVFFTSSETNYGLSQMKSELTKLEKTEK